MKTNILYEDADIFVISKPGGLAVQSARIGQMDVESELRNYLARQGQSPYIGLVHRLDQPVEGLLVVAKTKEAAASLSRQLTGGSLNKKYLAVVHLSKDTIAPEGDFTDYMAKEGQTARIVGHAEVCKKASLHYQILKKEGDLALADIHIETGRFHQIRCQMAYHGMPLLGDTKYGSSAVMDIGRILGIRQVALCADRVSFKHPVSGKFLEFQVTPENIAFAKFL